MTSERDCDYWKPIQFGGIALPCSCGNDCDQRFTLTDDEAAEHERDLVRLEILSEFPHQSLGPIRMHRLADEIIRLRSQLAAAERERDDAKINETLSNEQRGVLFSENAALLARVTELERDAERLEWLQRNCCEVVCHDLESDASHWEMRYQNPDDIDGAPLTADGETLRALIDAARTQTS